MIRWLTDRLPAARRRAKVYAEYEASAKLLAAAVQELARLGWREWLHQSPFGYPGLIEVVRLGEFMAGAWKREVFRYGETQPEWNVYDVWWRPVEGEVVEAAEDARTDPCAFRLVTHTELQAEIAACIGSPFYRCWPVRAMTEHGAEAAGQALHAASALRWIRWAQLSAEARAEYVAEAARKADVPAKQGG